MTKRELLLALEPFTDDIELMSVDERPLYTVYDATTGRVYVTDVRPIRKHPSYRQAVIGSYEQ